MHRGCPINLHKELIELRRRQGKLKELLSAPREKLEKQELIIKLRDVRGEIARIESQLHAGSGSDGMSGNKWLEAFGKPDEVMNG
jgi:hypothetical protein